MSEEIKEQHEVIINELKAQLDDLELFAFKQVNVKYQWLSMYDLFKMVLYYNCKFLFYKNLFDFT